MRLNIPNTPFSTRLSGNIKETELRIRNIFQQQKKRPPAVLFVLAMLTVIGCGGLVSCQTQEDSNSANNVEQTITAVQSGDVWYDIDDPSALVRREGVYNVLLAGTDTDGSHTDTMMVMSYDTKEQTVGIVSVPRDTLVERPADQNPKLVYGEGGVEQRVEDISHLLGVPIDYYIQIDLRGLIAVVDYLGGVDFYVPCDMDYDDPYQNLSIHFKEGMQHLDGQAVMELVRFRKNNDNSGYSDIGRAETQQKLLVALTEQVLSWDSLTKLNGFVEMFNEYVETNLTLMDMLYFASIACNIDTDNGVETTTLTGNGGVVWNGHSYCFQLDEEFTLDAVNRLINPYNRDLTREDMNIFVVQ